MSKSKQPTKKHIPTRTCVACRQKFEKRRLTRLVMNDGGLHIDPTGRLNGRGAYLCDSATCWQRASETSLLNRALRTSLTEVDKQRLRQHSL